ncbi:phosphate ABC transporter substrate-binding protein PstS family protein [Isobaculum melis]|uniref:Phosphate-binding protein n=1 Tax=Isobaculum melis TaxID=142588 RepID=A0A1H9QMX0_9LACT|nr:phosphate ABC transporter substrate-binding protein PstS family protein [Isobaculum melis]SER61555.1 phosphate ABC transporter substrate-binding protein, PhoT family [Isobaculum melis]
MGVKRLIQAGLIAGVAFSLAACGNKDGSTSASKEATEKNEEITTGSITAVGSTALQPLVEAAAEKYQENHAGSTINVQGGGSGTGLSQVATEAVEIGNSDVFAEEKEGVDAKALVDHRVAVVGITPVIHKDTGVTNLTKEQLIDIFTGKITNWKEVGGNNQEIVVVNRAAGSGTRASFEKWGLGGAKSIQSQEQDSSGAVRKIINETPGAISYLAFSYIDDQTKTLSIDQVKPTEANVATNDWKIWSYEHMYTKGEATGLTQSFLAYMMSAAVQDELVSKMGYLPITAMKVERDVDGTIK